MTYPEAVAYVLSLQAKGWRMGLDRIEELVRRAGLGEAIGPRSEVRGPRSAPESSGQGPVADRGESGPAFLEHDSRGPQTSDLGPQTSFPRFFHVAGTNGKGSVTQYIQSILHEAGYRVGGYYSPYVYEPRERIQFGRDLISEEDYASAVETLMPIAESMATPEYDGGVSKFEFETAMGFLYWQRQACDFVALEVGMGGRLDATNVVTPAASIIVSIGLDHTQYLGTTHVEVAREKAGIVKQGVPVICGAIPEPGLVEIEKIAAERSAPIWCFGQEIRPMPGPDGSWSIETSVGKREGLTPGMAGISQPHNLALAVAAIEAAAIEVSDEAMRLGAQRAKLPGRFERRLINGVEVVLDGAHNTEAAKVLVRNMQRAFPQQSAVLLTGMVDGHDPLPFYRALQPVVESAHVSPIDFHRAQEPDKVAAALDKVGVPTTTHQTVKEALHAALEHAKDNGAPLLIAGSFYLLGEVGSLLAE
ncbi:MAG: hypothetical protein HZC36_12915 [Armatimonadetes bacterium]|nr:hypothetical protein [Armatimonadota bacterium]